MIENLKKIFIYLIFLSILYLFYKIIKIFFVPFFWALIFSIIFYPLSLCFEKKLKGKLNCPLLTTLIFSLIIILPLTFFITKLSIELFSYTPEILKEISKSQSSMQKYYIELKRFLNDLGISLGDVTHLLAKKISVFLQKTFQNIIKLFFHLFFIIIFFYIFLKRRDFFIGILKDLLPFEDQSKEIFLKEIYSFIHAIFFGIFLTALIQGLFSLFGFYIFNVPFPLFFSTLIFLFSFIPIGGASIVWIPLSIYIMFSLNFKNGILLFLWCFLFVSTLDNFIRAYFISKKFKTDPFFIFLSVLGGIVALGPIGIFYGPLVFFSVYKILQYKKYSF